MITTFRAGSFKSLRDVELKLDDVTLLIGWNASGKSNLLEALALLCWSARAPRLSDLPHAIATGQLPIRGNVTDLVESGAGHSVVSLGCDVDEGGDTQGALTEGRVAGRRLGALRLDLSLHISAKDVHVQDEVLRSPSLETDGYKTPLYSAEGDAQQRRLRVTYQNFRRAAKPSILLERDQVCFAQLGSPASLPLQHAESREVLPAAARRVGDALAAVRFLDPDPRAMRGYAFLDESELRPDGANVSAVLRHLDDHGQRESILAFVAELPERPLAGLSFLDTPRNEVMVAIHESFGGERGAAVPAALLSDGTLRVLAIAAALLTAEPGSLVVIEEIDNGVHASRARLLLQQIIRVARQRSVRVLLTTHNPALQDALPEALLPQVALAWRDPGDGRTRVSRLGELEAFPRMIASGPLGQLVSQPAFERMVKQPTEAAATARFFAMLAGESSNG